MFLTFGEAHNANLLYLTLLRFISPKHKPSDWSLRTPIAQETRIGRSTLCIGYKRTHTRLNCLSLSNDDIVRSPLPITFSVPNISLSLMPDHNALSPDVGLLLAPSNLTNKKITIGYVIASPLFYHRHRDSSPTSYPDKGDENEVGIYPVRVIQSMNIGQFYAPGILYTPNTDAARDLAAVVLQESKGKGGGGFAGMGDDADRQQEHGFMDGLWKGQIAGVKSILDDHPALTTIQGWQVQNADTARNDRVVIVGGEFLEVSKNGCHLLCAPGVEWIDGEWSDSRGMEGMIIRAISLEGQDQKVAEEYRKLAGGVRNDSRNWNKHDLAKLYRPDHVGVTLETLRHLVGNVLEKDGWLVTSKTVVDTLYIVE